MRTSNWMLTIRPQDRRRGRYRARPPPAALILALGRLQAAFAMAVADGPLARNPVEHVTRPRQPSAEAARHLDADEVRAFLAEGRWPTGCTRPGGCRCTGSAAAKSWPALVGY